MPAPPTAQTGVREPKRTRGRDTLDRIVEAASALLDEKEFADVSVAEIMARAGMSVGSFYTRFRNKAALLPYLYERYDTGLVGTTGSILRPEEWEGLSLAERVARLVSLAVGSYREHKGLWRAILVHASPDDSIVTPAHRRRRRKLVRELAALLLARREELSHPSPEQAAEFALVLLFATCKDQILLEERSHGTPTVSDSRLKAELTRTLLAYLGMRGARGARGA
jgi:AcrR family transcriptional regulator